MNNSAEKICSYCRRIIKSGDRSYTCTGCDEHYHVDCWEENNGCTSYGCNGTPIMAVVDNVNVEKENRNVSEQGKVVYCSACGSSNSEGSRFCSSCGKEIVRAFQGYEPASSDYESHTYNYNNGYQQNSHSWRPDYAGFWRRFGAYIIDGIVLSPIHFIFADMDTENLWLLLIGWLYFALMESSGKRATLGKMAAGIQVVDYNGNRLSFGRASGRFFGKLLSVIILFIGYIMAAFTEKKQALHDIMAGTLVVKKGSVVAQDNYQYRG